MTTNKLALRAVETLADPSEHPVRRTKEESAAIKAVILDWASQDPNEREYSTAAALADALGVSKQFVSNTIRLNAWEILAEIRARGVSDIPAVLDSLLTQATQKGSTKAADVFLRFVQEGAPKNAPAPQKPLPRVVAEALAKLPIQPAFRPDDNQIVDAEIVEPTTENREAN